MPANRVVLKVTKSAGAFQRQIGTLSQRPVVDRDQLFDLAQFDHRHAEAEIGVDEVWIERDRALEGRDGLLRPRRGGQGAGIGVLTLVLVGFERRRPLQEIERGGEPLLALLKQQTAEQMEDNRIVGPRFEKRAIGKLGGV